MLTYYQELDINGSPVGEPLLSLDGIVPVGNFIPVVVEDTIAQTALQVAPTAVSSNENATIEENTQLIFVEEIFIDGILSLYGDLIEED